MTRLLVAVSVLSLVAIALSYLLVPDPRARAWVAVAAVVGVLTLTLAVLHSLRSDRRYAEILEREVSNQTRTLMDSLGATAAAERNLRLVMEAVPDAIALVDREGRTLEMNGPAARMFGDADVLAFAIADAAHTVRENLDAAFSGEVRRFEASYTRADESRGISAVLCAPVREGTRISKVLVLAHDITDLRRGERQLRRAEKLAALGQLVSGVAHEINNPAAIISGFAQTLLLDDLRPEHREMVRMVHDEATRIGRITANLLAFARAGGRDRALIDLNDIVRRTFALRSYHLTTLNIAVTLALDPSEPKVWGNGSELQQMLLNLLINAEQALVTVDAPRTVTLRTRSAEHEVTLECADSGPGVPLEIRDRIFDPFFTTKVEGEGTGLGLSISYGIVQDHGGRLTVESEPEGGGGGATFLVTLPRDPRALPRASLEGARPPALEAGPLSVLFVDDEPGLRSAVARFLNRRGIQCRTAGDGSEALEVLRRHDFDIILSDVRMPGMNGREFLTRLRADRPELVRRLVFSTGDNADPETAALVQEAGVPSLVKPFDFTQLETLIREVAARVSPGAPP